MSLESQIMEDLKDAMRNKRAEEVSALRMIQADLKNVKINNKGELTDDDVMSAITKAIKQRKDSVASFKEAGRGDAVEKEEKEIAMLKKYLPEEMSEEAVRDIINKVIADAAAEGMKDIGKVMGPVMQEVKGRADGAFVKELVEEQLKEEKE